MKYLKWMAETVRPYRAAMAVMMICHVVIACFAVGFVYVSKRLVDVAVAIFDGRPSGSDIWPWAVALAGIILSRILLNAIRSYLQTKTDIRLRNALQAQDIRYSSAF